MPGHDSGHDDAPPPAGLTWADYLAAFVTAAGGWTALADDLIARAAATADIPTDALSVEKGLRRLAKRDARPGGQYGRWMLKFFGVPPRVEDWTRWMAQYHSRFADLPASLRLQQLRLWDRPPVSESRAAVWIDIGLASVHHRMQDMPACDGRLDAARRAGDRAPADARIELALLDARIAMDAGDRDRAHALLDTAGSLLDDTPSLDAADRHCYRARHRDQRAYALTHPVAPAPPDYTAALSLYDGIPADTGIPFVDFRRALGRAYCTWRLGDRDAAASLAHTACEHAGDGGFVRFRVMSLNLLSRMVDEPASARHRDRATRLARQLEDEDLLHRLHTA